MMNQWMEWGYFIACEIRQTLFFVGLSEKERAICWTCLHMAMDQYLYIPFLGG